MFLVIIVISLIHLLGYDLIGKGVKRIFKINFSGMNLLIGYSFSLLLFYLYIVIIGRYSFLLFLILLIPFIYKGLDKKVNYDLLIIGIIILYITHFFTLTFVSPVEAKEYLINLNRNLNLSVFQTFTLLEAKFFKLHPVLYTINIMTIINLFIILYTIFECMEVLFTKKRIRRLAFLLFLLLFTVVNSPNKNVPISQNAYLFLFHPFSGKAFYLYALIPFQFILFYKLDKKNDLLLVLINLSCMAFTSISVFMQIILNLSYVVVLILIKNREYLYRFVFLSLYPLLIHFIIFKDTFKGLFLFIILLAILFLIISWIKYNHKYKESNLSLYSVVILLILFSFMYISNLDFDFWKTLTNFPHENKGKTIIVLYYGLLIYSLIKLYKDKTKITRIFFIFQIVLIFVVVNPLTVFILLRFKYSFINLLFLLPSTFTIIYVFFKHTKIIEKTLIILLIISVSQTVYYPLEPINQTKLNVYYRFNKEAIDISLYLNKHKKIENIIVSENIRNEILINTKTNVLIDENDDITFVNLMINDIVPFDLFQFIETIESSHIDAIIIDKDKMVNSYLKVLSTDEKHFDYYTIYFI